MATTKPRSKPAPPMTAEDVQFIIANITTKSYADIATERGITKNQVNRVRTDVVNGLKELAKGNPAKAASIEEYIKNNLTRPEETRVGAKGGGQAKAAIDNVVGNILDSL